MAILIWTLPDMWIWLVGQELEVTMTLNWGLEQLGLTILSFHFLTVSLMIGTLCLILLCQLPVWIPSELDYWIIFVHSFILLSRNEISDFNICLLFSYFSSFFFLIQRIVIYISLGEQFLYGNSVSPIAFLYLLYFYMVIKI